MRHLFQKRTPLPLVRRGFEEEVEEEHELTDGLSAGVSAGEVIGGRTRRSTRAITSRRGRLRNRTLAT